MYLRNSACYIVRWKLHHKKCDCYFIGCFLYHKIYTYHVFMSVLFHKKYVFLIVSCSFYHKKSTFNFTRCFLYYYSAWHFAFRVWRNILAWFSHVIFLRKRMFWFLLYQEILIGLIFGCFLKSMLIPPIPCKSVNQYLRYNLGYKKYELWANIWNSCKHGMSLKQTLD